MLSHRWLVSFNALMSADLDEKLIFKMLSIDFEG